MPTPAPFEPQMIAPPKGLDPQEHWEALMKDVPYSPSVMPEMSPEKQARMTVFIARLRKSVEMQAGRELTSAQFENERLLAGFARELGDEAIAWTPDEALEKSIAASRNRRLAENCLRLAQCLERRAAYEVRLF